MATTATCTCGHSFTFETDEEYYGLVRRHILPLAREKHRLAAIRPGRAAAARAGSRDGFGARRAVRSARSR